jgi:hypothetical protein
MVKKMIWIRVEDGLPDPEVKVLAYDTQRIYIAFRRKEEEYNEHWVICQDLDYCEWGITSAVTHWMPYPEKPVHWLTLIPLPEGPDEVD